MTRPAISLKPKSNFLLAALAALAGIVGFVPAPAAAGWDPETGKLASAPVGKPAAALNTPAAAPVKAAMAAPADEPIQVGWSNPGPLGTVPPTTESYVLTPGPGDTCILYGGYTSYSGVSNDVHQVDAAGRWTKIAATGTKPSACAEAAGVYDAPGNRVVIFGGSTNSSTVYNDLYALDLGSNAWTKLNATGTPPSPRRAHSGVYDPLRRRMVVFGGTNSSTISSVFNDAYALDLATLTWSRLTPSSGALPGVRAHTAAYIPGRDAMAIFGGDNERNAYNDIIYLYSFADNKVSILATSGTPHPGVIGAASAFDSASNSLFILGGLDANRNRAGLSAVKMDSGQWQWLVVGYARPSLRHWIQMVPLQKPDRFLTHGGLSSDGQYLNDTWIMTLGERVPVELSGFAAE